MRRSLKKGRGTTMTHDYKRNGTATLFAALSTLDGTVIGMWQERHSHQEWLKFMRVIDDVTPADKEVHLIADNYSTHKHAEVQRWLKRHPRFQVYFTPTSASWLNRVERFFIRGSIAGTEHLSLGNRRPPRRTEREIADARAASG